MKNFISLFFKFSLTAFMFWGLSGCSDETPPPPSPPAAAAPAAPAAPRPQAPLALLRLWPSGEAPRLTQVVAMFNQPMVALGDYERVPEGALSLSPDLPGRRLWLNQYTLAFIPEKPLTGSLHLKITLDPGLLTALSGEKLPAGKITAEARLPLLAAQANRLLNDEAAEEEEALKPRWRATFNQPPEAASLEKRAFFIWEEKGAPVRRAAQVQKGSSAETFLFSTPEKLPRDTPYKLVLEAGAVSLAGPEPAPEITLAEGRTFGPLTVAWQGAENLENWRPYWGPPNLVFSNPVDLAEITPLLRLEPETDLNSLIQAYAKDGAESGEEDRIRRVLGWEPKLKGETEYQLTIDPSARDVFGQPLGEIPPLTFRTRAHDSYLSLSGEYALLETGAPPRLPLRVSNLPRAFIEGFALTPEEAVPFLAAAASDYGSYLDDEEAGQALKGRKPAGSLTLNIPGGAQDGPRTLPVNLAELFGESRLGHLLVVRGRWRDEKGEARSTWATAQISDLGLTVKTAPEAGLIWTTNLAEARAWPGVELEVRDKDNNVRWRGVSGPDGLAALPGKLLDDASAPLFVTARAAGQMALWSSAWRGELENWRWNLNAYDGYGLERAKEEGQHWLLSALPIYKPGDTAKFKLILRQGAGDLLREPAGEEIRLELRDPLGETADSAIIAASAFGTFSHEFALPADAHLGDWQVLVALPGPEGDELDYAGSFKVMTYRPPALEIKLEGLPPAALAGDRVELGARADYHFGSPAAERPAKYEIISSPAWFRLPGPYADFDIMDELTRRSEDDDGTEGYEEPSETAASGAGTLDRAGGLKFGVDLAPPADRVPRPRSYAAHFTVTDVDGRTVSASGGFMVHPAALYAGLSTPFLGQVGESRPIKLIAADAEGRLAAGRKLEVALFRRVWRSARRKTPGSAYEYVSRLVDEKVAEASLVSAETPVVWPATPDKPGYYWVRVSLKDEAGRPAQAARGFYVAGPGEAGWRPGQEGEPLLLVPDKPAYQPGDVARIMVQSPFDQGEGLLTVERSGVRRSESFRIENSAPTLEVPIGADDAPNLFVSVLLARGRLADKPDRKNMDFGKPLLRAGYTELKIPSKADLLTVKVEVEPAETGPGEEATVRLSVADDQGRPFSEAEAALIVADAAVIQVAGDRGYHPESQYCRDYPLLVQTASNIFSLLSREDFGLKGGEPGGGGGISAALADETRRRFAALAFFEPALRLDAQGRAEVKIKMPENLTTFKIYAVATGHGRKTGTGQSSILVTRDLLARQALPGHAAAGDEFQASVVVSDRGVKGGRAEVSLEGENFALLEDSALKTVDLEPGRSREVLFKVKAGVEGTAKFRFRAAMGRDVDQAEFSLPVSPVSPLAVQGAFELLEGSAELALACPPGADPDRGGLTAELAPSFLGVLKGPLDWLLAYPHGCVEQTVSKAFANLLSVTLADRLGTGPDEAETARRQVRAVLAQLAQWELDGGYNYWPGEYDWSRRSVFLTAYVLDFLLDAKEAGLEPSDGELAQRLVWFLTRAANGDKNGGERRLSPEAELDSRLYALAVLARAGGEVSAAIEVLYPRREEMTLFQLANLLRAVTARADGVDRTEQKQVLLELLTGKHFIFTPSGADLSDPRPGPREIWSSSRRSAALAVTALAAAAPESPLLPGLVRRLTEGARGGHFGSTQDNVAVLRALAAAARVLEPSPPNMTVAARLTGPEGDPAGGGETAPLLAGAFRSFMDPPLRGSAPLSALNRTDPKLKFELNGQGRLWAAFRLASAPAEPDFSAWSNGGFMLSRDYVRVAPQPGQPGAERFRRGDTVRATVTLVVPEPRHGVVLEDFTPAGFEPINFNLADADMTLLNLAEPENEGEDEGYRRRFWYDHQEIWPGRVAVYADFLEPGVYTFSYLARAATPGIFKAPGPRAEEMYAPENAGRGQGGEVIVEE